MDKCVYCGESALSLTTSKLAAYGVCWNGPDGEWGCKGGAFGKQLKVTYTNTHGQEPAKPEAPRMAKVGERWSGGIDKVRTFVRTMPSTVCACYCGSNDHEQLVADDGYEVCPVHVAKAWDFIPSPTTEGTSVPWKVGQRRRVQLKGDTGSTVYGQWFEGIVESNQGGHHDWKVRIEAGPLFVQESWPNELLADAPQDVGVPEPAKPAPQPTRSCDRCGKHHSEPTAWSLCHRCNDIVDQGTATVPSALGQGVGKAQNPLPFSCTNTLESGYPCNRTDPHPAGWACRVVPEQTVEKAAECETCGRFMASTTKRWCQSTDGMELPSKTGAELEVSCDFCHLQDEYEFTNHTENYDHIPREPKQTPRPEPPERLWEGLGGWGVFNMKGR